jgi:hypothetical protein
VNAVEAELAMDNETLLELFGDTSKRQFWVKPWGDPDRPADERESFTDDEIRLNFAKQPTGVELGDVLFVHRIKAAKLACVARAITSPRELTATEIMREPMLKRWPWVIEGSNLTPKLGRWWRECSLKTFTLANEYNKLNPNEQVNLGSLMHGTDKLRISDGFATFLLETIIGID